jgi:hypothetical protein
VLIADHIVAAARAVPIPDILARRGHQLRRSGKEMCGPCPVCGGHDRFGVNIPKGVWNCRGCQRGGDVIELVRFLDDCPFTEAVARLAGERSNLPSRATLNIAHSGFTRHGKCGSTDHTTHIALGIWNETCAATKTPVDLHLAKRRVKLPPRCSAIRFHARCPFGKDADGSTIYTPAMVALVTNIINNKPQAIHRTALDLDGNQVEIGGCKRMTLGPIAGGAVKLTPDEDVAIAIGIAEGLETAFSLAALPEWADSPVWCVLSRTGLADFPVLAGIETLAVAVDNDEPGEKAARRVIERWYRETREVLSFEGSEPGTDLNDILRHE